MERDINTLTINGVIPREITNVWQEMTENNYHTVARQMVAEYFGLSPYARLFADIERQHEKEGCLTPRLERLRIFISRRMKNALERKYGANIAKQAYDCL